jgi:hypothetical protein
VPIGDLMKPMSEWRIERRWKTAPQQGSNSQQQQCSAWPLGCFACRYPLPRRERMSKWAYKDFDFPPVNWPQTA